MWSKDKLMGLIGQKESYMKNNKKTAQEEKKMLDEINKMKSTLKYLPLIAKLTEKKDNYYKDYKVVRGKARGIQEKITKEKNEMEKLKRTLDENKEDEEKKEEVELDENGNPIKKKRQLTKEEQELEGKIQKIKTEIGDLYSKKDERRAKNKADMLEYEMKFFEKKKAEFMVSIQTRLKREEKRKEREEEQKKYREENEKYEKERLKTKYQ